jgi:hypothetical protein
MPSSHQDNGKPMPKFNTFTHLKGVCFRNRFLIMLSLLLLLLLLMPLQIKYLQLKIIFNLLTLFIFTSGINAISQRRSYAIAGAIMTIVFGILVLERHYDYLIPEEILMTNIIGIIYLLFLIITILRFIYSAKVVTTDIIFASIVVYLLMGLLFAFGYEIIDALQEAPFSIPAGLSETLRTKTQYLFLYYSFVTLTTLGYGDISPNNVYGASMSMIEAIVGQIYLVVQVAWLVGMHVSRKSK